MVFTAILTKRCFFPPLFQAHSKTITPFYSIHEHFKNFNVAIFIIFIVKAIKLNIFAIKHAKIQSHDVCSHVIKNKAEHIRFVFDRDMKRMMLDVNPKVAKYVDDALISEWLQDNKPESTADEYIVSYILKCMLESRTEITDTIQEFVRVLTPCDKIYNDILSPALKNGWDDLVYFALDHYVVYDKRNLHNVLVKVINKNNTELIKDVIERADVNININCDLDKSLINAAALANNVELVKWLKSQGASINKKSRAGKLAKALLKQ